MNTRKSIALALAATAAVACAVARPYGPGGLAGASRDGAEASAVGSGDAASRPAPSSWISGRVAMGGTTQAVAGATVAAFPDAQPVDGPSYQAVTSGDGSFRLTLPEGTYNLVARKPGSKLQAVVWRIQTATSVNISLAPTGAIRGNVTASGVTDLTGTDVFVPGTDIFGTTDASGSFLLRDVPIATYSVAVRFPGYALGKLANVAVLAAATTEAATIDLTPALPTPTPAPTPKPPYIAPMIGKLAPDDTASASVTHDYQLTVGGVTSTFVWIPVFKAFQVINPADAGCATCAVGFWVKNKPNAGIENIDWGSESFGGFYAAKFEAAHADAVPGNPSTGAGATQGTSTTLKVAQYCSPWGNIKWDTAVTTAATYYPDHSHLMRDDEWTALAVWSMIEGKTVFGNNIDTANGLIDPPADIDSTDVTFIRDPADPTQNRALTGSATSSLWASGINRTTHTGTTTGVHDLNGNVFEWALNLGGAATSGNYTLYDPSTNNVVDLGLSVGPANSAQTVRSLSTDPRWRRFGLPASTGASGGPFKGDILFKNTAGDFQAIRGGWWRSGTGAGVWTISIDSGSTVYDLHGFRPTLVFEQ